MQDRRGGQCQTDIYQGHRCSIWEFPGQEVKAEFQLPAYTVASATQNLSHICGLHHNSWQCQILNVLGEVRDQTHILMDTSQVHYCCATMGTSNIVFASQIRSLFPPPLPPLLCLVRLNLGLYQPAHFPSGCWLLQPVWSTSIILAY